MEKLKKDAFNILAGTDLDVHNKVNECVDAINAFGAAIGCLTEQVQEIHAALKHLGFEPCDECRVLSRVDSYFNTETKVSKNLCDNCRPEKNTGWVNFHGCPI